MRAEQVFTTVRYSDLNNHLLVPIPEDVLDLTTFHGKSPKHDLGFRMQLIGYSYYAIEGETGRVFFPQLRDIVNFTHQDILEATRDRALQTHRASSNTIFSKTTLKERFVQARDTAHEMTPRFERLFNWVMSQRVFSDLSPEELVEVMERFKGKVNIQLTPEEIAEILAKPPQIPVLRSTKKAVKKNQVKDTAPAQTGLASPEEPLLSSEASIVSSPPEIEGKGPLLTSLNLNYSILSLRKVARNAPDLTFSQEEIFRGLLPLDGNEGQTIEEISKVLDLKRGYAIRSFDQGASRLAQVRQSSDIPPYTAKYFHDVLTNLGDMRMFELVSSLHERLLGEPLDDATRTKIEQLFGKKTATKPSRGLLDVTEEIQQISAQIDFLKCTSRRSSLDAHGLIEITGSLEDLNLELREKLELRALYVGIEAMRENTG
jgi:hypothetical protein